MMELVRPGMAHRAQRAEIDKDAAHFERALPHRALIVPGDRKSVV